MLPPPAVFGPSASFSNVSSDILHKVVDEVSGKSFIARDPDDGEILLHTSFIVTKKNN